MKAIGTLKQGEKFDVAGREYVALDKHGDGMLCIEAKSFDDVGFGDTNDFRTSDIRKYLNGDYLAELEDNGLDTGKLLTLRIDLKETSGGREYGYDECKVGLLTLEQYVKYAEYIPLDTENGWWLATPWGTPWLRSPGTSSSDVVWFVGADGGLGSDGAYYSRGIRPALVFSSDLLVSCDGEDEETTVYGQLLRLIDKCGEEDLRLAVHAIGEKMLSIGRKDKANA